jgi:hypothetical protein
VVAAISSLGRCCSLLHLILEGDSFGVDLLKPMIGRFLDRKHPEMISLSRERIVVA